MKTVRHASNLVMVVFIISLISGDPGFYVGGYTLGLRFSVKLLGTRMSSIESWTEKCSRNKGVLIHSLSLFVVS